jgi:signal peptidase II
LLALLISLAIIAADQYTKWLMMEKILTTKETGLGFQEWLFTRAPISFFIEERPLFQTVAVTSFLNWVMVWNQGISFGLFNNNSEMGALILIAFSLILTIGLIFWNLMAQKFIHMLGLSFIIGGAIGNIIDRVRFGAVVDFVDVHVAGFHWPAFNIADSFIVIGGILLAIHIIFEKEPHER